MPSSAKPTFWRLPLALAGLAVGIAVGGLGLLFVLNARSTVPMRRKANAQICAMQRDLIDSAKQLWALEQRKTEKDTPAVRDLRSYLKNGQFPDCPDHGSYSINAVDQPCTCTAHQERGQ